MNLSPPVFKQNTKSLGTKKIADGSQLTCYPQALISSAIVNYWSVKEIAIKCGRLKSTRSPKFFDNFNGRSLDDRQAKTVAERINYMALREHSANLQHLASLDKIIGDKAFVESLSGEAQYGFNIRFAHPHRQDRLILYAIKQNMCENITAADFSRFFAIETDSPSIHGNYGGLTSLTAQAENFQQQLKRIADSVRLVQKLKQALATTKWTVNDLERYDSKIQVRFERGTAEELTAENILAANIVFFDASRKKQHPVAAQPIAVQPSPRIRPVTPRNGN